LLLNQAHYGTGAGTRQIEVLMTRLARENRLQNAMPLGALDPAGHPTDLWPRKFAQDYSVRGTVVGSMSMARRAGRSAASTAMVNSVTETRPSVRGSRAETPLVRSKSQANRELASAPHQAAVSPHKPTTVIHIASAA